MTTNIPMYDFFVGNILSSNAYLNATAEGRETMHRFIENPKVKSYFEGRFVTQLDLHESLVHAVESCEEFRQRTTDDRIKIVRYINSSSFKRRMKGIEERLSA